MEKLNQNSSDFTLLGLFPQNQTGLLLLLLVISIFSVALLGNSTMIHLIRVDPRLHTPMYFLLSQLSLMDLMDLSATVPKMAFNFLSGQKTISFLGCGVQSFFFLTMAGSEGLLLASMAYDRFVAICHPLHYPVRMSKMMCLKMIIGSWLVGILNSIVHTSFALHFPFCHSRAIDHFFCEVPAMLKLSCVDTTHYERGVYVSGIIFLLIPFSIISISYVQILLTVFQMQSGARQKSLSTCSFHMVVVIMYYGPFIFTYMRPRSYHAAGQDKFLAVFYTILTPSLNPIIYSFRNKDVLMAVKNIIQRAGIKGMHHHHPGTARFYC
ncbi:Olfactory receptor 2AJ1 [Lemmus lemmus]